MFRELWKRFRNIESHKTGRRGKAPQRRRGPETFKARFEILEDRLNLSSVFLVTNSSDNLSPGSLRYAIAEANLAANQGSTVAITSKVTGPIDLTHGALNIQSSVTIENQSGAPLDIHQSTPGARVIQISGTKAVNVAISGTADAPLTIDGGSVGSNNDSGDGGGILDLNSSNVLTLTNVDVVGNHASASGGGIYTAGTAVLNQSTVGTNVAGQFGGGFWATGGATLNASTVQGNQAAVGGGGVFVNYGTLNIASASDVIKNSSATGNGGGVSVATGTVNVTGGSHVDNNSARDAGGILVGNVPSPGIPSGDTAVSVSGASTVNGNSSTGGQNQSTSDLGGGGISVITFGNVTIDDSQVSNNTTVGMYSGGILLTLGGVTVTNGSMVDGNHNNGPGGGIAANFGGTITLSNNSQVDGNTGAGLGGGIVNFAGPTQGVNVSGNSQVSNNTLTNAESIGRVAAVFVGGIVASNASYQNFAAAAGGKGGADMIAGLKLATAAAEQFSPSLQTALDTLTHPVSILVAGGGIATFAAPISVTGDSQVSGNLSGQNIFGTDQNIIGLGGGIVNFLGSVSVDHSDVDNNQAPSTNGDGGGIWIGSGSLNLTGSSTVSGNASGGLGGGTFNATGQVTIANSTLQSDTSVSGGAIASAGTLTVTGSSILNNTATNEGGGVYNGGTYDPVNVVYNGNSPDNVYNY